MAVRALRARRGLAPLRRHWQGRLPVWVSVFVVLVAGRIAVVQIWLLLPAPLPRPEFLTLIAADAALALWQGLGAWRAITHGLDDRAQRLQILAARLIVLLALPVTLSGWLDHIAAQVPLPPQRAAPVQPLPVADGVALLAGDIDYSALARFEATPAGSFSTLRLDSPGGLVYAARALAQRVAQRGLATEVTGQCLSSCTLVFLAAETRTLGRNGRLGFHAYAFLGHAPVVDVAAEERRDSLFLQSRGVSESFIARVEATPNRMMWFPDRATLRAAGVLRGAGAD